MANSAIETDGLQEQIKQLHRIMSDDPEFRKRVESAIKEVFRQVRKEVSSAAKTELKSDPRKAYKAVRTSIYRRIIGGQVNILQKLKAGSPGNYQKPLKGLPKRGGNRWGRSQRTIDLEGYKGTDRGFVLRFLNAGTEDRMIHTYTDPGGSRHNLNSGSTANIKAKAIGGNRGQIVARNWFGSASHKALEGAADQLQELIDRVISGMFK